MCARGLHGQDHLSLTLGFGFGLSIATENTYLEVYKLYDTWIFSCDQMPWENVIFYGFGICAGVNVIIPDGTHSCMTDE